MPIIINYVPDAAYPFAWSPFDGLRLTALAYLRSVIPGGWRSTIPLSRQAPDPDRKAQRRRHFVELVPL